MPEPIQIDVAKLHGEHCKLAWDAIRSSSDEYDKNILQLASALLALSISFIKDLIKPHDVQHYYSLYISWSAFGIAIIAVVMSFQFSIAAHKRHLQRIDAYYLNANKTALTEVSVWDRLLTFTNYVAGCSFFAGVCCTIYFVSRNFRS